jgi:transcriptional regulator with XRE-family HTH domain
VPLTHAGISALEIARKSAGLTAADLAKGIGVSPSHISQIERGWRTPSLAVKQRSASLLGAHVDDLFPPSATPALLAAADHVADQLPEQPPIHDGSPAAEAGLPSKSAMPGRDASPV